MEGDGDADRGNDGKTTSKSGLALSGISYNGKPKTARSGGSWLLNLHWYPNGQSDYGIDEMSEDSHSCSNGEKMTLTHRYCVATLAISTLPALNVTTLSI